MTEAPAARSGVGVWAAAILLPPLAAFLLRGMTRDFWITCALTMIGYLPGAGYAIYLAIDDGRSSSQARAVAA